MIRRPPRSTQSRSSAASDVYKRQLDAVGTIEKPGTIIELPYTWPEEDFRKRDWFPKEPTPWMSSQDAINEMLDFIQHGDPLE